MRLIGLAVTLALGLLTLGLALGPLAVEAQQAGKVWRIGVIINTYSVADAVGPTPRNEHVAALLRGLRDLGYVYGRDFVTESRSTEARIERSRAIAAELAGLPVDVIVAAGPTLFGVKQAGIATPVVMIGVGFPVQDGFITSLARPGGSFTGLAGEEQLARKRLQLVTELVPGALRVGVLRGPDSDRASDRAWKEIQEAARLLKREVLSLQVQSASEIEGAFRAATERRANALLVIPTAVLDQEARQVVERAARHRLPTMYTFRSFYMGEGGLISYGVDLVDTWRRPPSTSTSS